LSSWRETSADISHHCRRRASLLVTGAQRWEKVLRHGIRFRRRERGLASMHAAMDHQLMSPNPNAPVLQQPCPPGTNPGKKGQEPDRDRGARSMESAAVRSRSVPRDLMIILLYRMPQSFPWGACGTLRLSRFFGRRSMSGWSQTAEISTPPALAPRTSLP
jgi:hypothetical protein